MATSSSATLILWSWLAKLASVTGTLPLHGFPLDARPWSRSRAFIVATLSFFLLDVPYHGMTAFEDPNTFVIVYTCFLTLLHVIERYWYAHRRNRLCLLASGLARYNEYQPLPPVSWRTLMALTIVGFLHVPLRLVNLYCMAWLWRYYKSVDMNAFIWVSISMTYFVYMRINYALTVCPVALLGAYAQQLRLDCATLLSAAETSPVQRAEAERMLRVRQQLLHDLHQEACALRALRTIYVTLTVAVQSSLRYSATLRTLLSTSHFGWVHFTPSAHAVAHEIGFAVYCWAHQRAYTEFTALLRYIEGYMSECSLKHRRLANREIRSFVFQLERQRNGCYVLGLFHLDFTAMKVVIAASVYYFFVLFQFRISY